MSTQWLPRVQGYCELNLESTVLGKTSKKETVERVKMILLGGGGQKNGHRTQLWLI